MFDIREDIKRALEVVADDLQFGTGADDIDIDGILFEIDKGNNRCISVDRDKFIDESKRVRLRVRFSNHIRLSMGLKRLRDVAKYHSWVVRAPIINQSTPMYRTTLSDIMSQVVCSLDSTILSGHYDGTMDTFTKQRDPNDYPLIPKVWIDSIGNHPKSTAITLNFISPFADPIFPNAKCVSPVYPSTITIGADSKQRDKIVDLFIDLRDHATIPYGFPESYPNLQIRLISDSVVACGDGLVQHLYTGCCAPSTDAGIGFFVCFILII